MYAIKMTQRGNDIQEQIIQTCLQMLSSGQRWDNLSVIDLCKAAGVSHKTFYQNFGCKDDAVVLMLDQFISEVSAKADFVSVLTEFESRKSFLDTVARNGWNGRLAERWLAFCFEVRPREVDAIFLNGADEKMNMIYRFFISGTVEIMLEWHKTGFKTPKKEVAELLSVLCSHYVFDNPYLNRLNLETIDLSKAKKD